MDDPYEAPESPDVVVDTLSQGPAASAEYLLGELARLGWLPRDFGNADASPTPSRASTTGRAGSRSA